MVPRARRAPFRAGPRGGDARGPTAAAVRAARAAVPNDTDLIISPTAATCYKCHDSNPAAFHFGHNGGVIDAERASALGD